ncbi:ATP-dependent DNA ligase [Candidatus Woesearchaeota archaeon]|nr:ATP-dependent DNA ligase [Candidatus Woesearchaeota archaeon]
MLYKELVEVYEKISGTTKRLEKTYFVSKLIKKIPLDELSMALLLLRGELYPAWDKQEIGVASRLVLKAINVATGISVKKIEEGWGQTGDLGECAKNFISEKKQVTLFSQSLDVEKVFKDLRKLTTVTGKGAVDQKVKIISGLLSSASPDEARYIVRTVLEDLRVGVGEGTIRDAIVWSCFPPIAGIFFKCQKCGKFIPNADKCVECGESIDNKFSNEINRLDKGNKVLEVTSLKDLKDIQKYDFIVCETDVLARGCYNYLIEIVQSAYDMKNDFSEVAVIARKKGIDGLLDVEMEAGKPIKVMLYQKSKGITDAFETVGIPAAIEYKYDGFRIQIHKFKSGIKIFTRRLDDVTTQFPDIVKVVKKNVKGDSFIIDAEVVGYDKKTKTYLPFQGISQRIKRKYDIEKMCDELPVELNTFDIVFYNGKNLLKEPFSKRRAVLVKAVKEEPYKVVLAKQLITESVEEAEKFYSESLDAGEEGIMVKKLDAPYKPGSRVGYGVKVKPVMETLDLVIIGAEWGKGKRKGWLSSFEIACVDEEGNLYGIGKVGTGIKELETEGVGATFDQLTKLLKPLITAEKGTKVVIKPTLVVEVNYEEIQKSPTYNSGYALRFPRMIQIREDKPINEASTLELVKELYHSQR